MLMTPGLYRRWLIIAIAGSICIPHAAAAAEYYIGFDVGSLAGDFGSTVDSKLYSFTLAGGLIAPVYDVSVSIPYMLQNNDPGFDNEGVGDVLLQVIRSAH